ncbi:MAG: aldehyde dehydrogenase family protein [Candidatus Saccharibacteria bacterium]|nr:aldehyde dehydrogenase family protein [Candidatus Saccharibacteria bacterium]
MSPDNSTLLADELRNLLEDNAKHLKDLSMKATENDLAATEVDLARSLDFLQKFNHTDIPKNRKPKGDILIILSYNEPLLVSVVPIFCALAVGNRLVVRPASRNADLFRTIWANLIQKHNLEMSIIDAPYDAVGGVIKSVQAVSFFGSYKNARAIYKQCAEEFVEFLPELESADVKVCNVENNINETKLHEDVRTTIENAFDHNGRMCQRLSGIFVNRTIYPRYLSQLVNFLKENGFKETSKLDPSLGPIVDDIAVSSPAKMYQHKSQVVVVEPNPDGEFIRNAYFNESLWIKPYDTARELFDELNSRQFFLGLNIVSDNPKFVDDLIKATRFSRYTLIPDHSDIGRDYGWGGNWPTGTSGYTSWYEKFSNQYVEIR